MTTEPETAGAAGERGELAKLRKSQQRLRAFLSATFNVVYRMSADWSEMRQLDGKDFIADTTEPERNWLSKYIYPDDQARVTAAIQAAIRDKSVFELEHRVLRVDGSLGWTCSRAVPLLDDSGTITEWVGAATDVSEKKRHEQHQRMLLNELNHRVNNTLATVQAIAHQTMRDDAGPAEARKKFESRLIALSRAHDVLTREHWEAASLNEIAAGALAPYSNEYGSNRLNASGSDIRLSPGAALSIAMAIHELAINALKYGALSNTTGCIVLKWFADRPNDAFHMQWQEKGGPPVESPGRRGFGSRLLERGLASDLGGTVNLDFAADGVICRVTARLARLTAEGEPESHRDAGP